MRLTVGKKLGLGFATVIGLMVLSAIIAYLKIGAMEQRIRAAVERSYPAALLCGEVIRDVDDSMIALRNYLILGSDLQSRESLKSRRLAALKRVDQKLGDLSRLLQDATDGDETRRVIEVVTALDAFRNAQQKVEAIAHTDKSVPSQAILTNQALPLAERMDQTLAALMAEESTADATAERKTLLFLLANLQNSFSRGVTETRNYLRWGDVSSKQDADTHWRVYQEVSQRIAALADPFTAKQRELWQDFTRFQTEFQPLPAKMISLRDAPDWNQSNYLLAQEVIPTGDRMKETLDRLRDAITEDVNQQGHELLALDDSLAATLITATLASVLIGSIAALALSRRIVSGIQNVVEGARRIASGDLTGKDAVVRTQDEIGELASTFNTMRVGLRELAAQIRQATENVSATAAEMLASTQQQAASTKEQAATVQEITATIEEINQSGAQIGERAKQVSSAVEATSKATVVGMKATQETSRNMDTIRNQVEEVAENIVGLSERTQTIGEIIATVSEIAEQSNLLALNASIEAVAAGTQGSRFSVVAHEMKNLADRAKDCTTQVRTILSEIQKGINTSVLLAEEAVKRVDGGKQQADSAEQSIRQMTDTTERSIQAFEQILGGTNQQQLGVAQVAQGMQDIRQAATQTAAGTAQLEKAAAGLNALNQQLRTAVQQYRI